MLGSVVGTIRTSTEHGACLRALEAWRGANEDESEDCK
jgi:hypothetical protein